MQKYYRVKQDTFIWEKGAIITNTANSGSGYEPIEDIWNVAKKKDYSEYISDYIIESPNNSKYFERVYKSGLKGLAFKTADQLKASYNKHFKQ